MKNRLAFFLLVLALLVCFAGAAFADEIVLTGGASLNWPCGIPFHDPGFEVRGPAGEDRSAEVSVSGALTAWRVGDYVLSYALPDGTKAQRTVHIVPQTLPETVQPPSGTICLSFDDGPCENTQEVLDILAKYNVKATFFIIGNQTKYLHMLPRIVEAGHTLGIHAYDHGSYEYLYMDAEHYFGDLLAAQEVIYDYTGQYAHVLRFPGGGWTASYLTSTLEGGYDELFRMLHDAGIREYDWNVQPESGTKTTEGTVTDFTHPKKPYEYAIVLQHDTRRFSVAALERMIEWAQAEGYTFAPLDPSFPELHQVQ